MAGRHRWKCNETIDHGIRAMEYVHRFGGVVEHPVGSHLFKVYGRGGWTERVNQGDFGHLAVKPTRLYWHPAAAQRSAPVDGTLAVR